MATIMGLLAKLCVLLAATMFAVEGAIISIARLTSHDLLAPYLAVMPGQSIDGLKDYPCRFLISKTSNTQWGSCQFPADWGAFGQITLTAYNHIIQQAEMTVQSGQLHFGDLILCWGKPSLETYGSQAANWVARWGSEVSTDVTLEDGIANMNDFLPVQYLIIEGQWRPCRSA